MNTNTQNIILEKIAKSKINQVDFDNLAFGSVFTDHMFECDFRDGEWQTPTIKPYGRFLWIQLLRSFIMDRRSLKE